MSDKLENIGALWEKENDKGRFFTGNIKIGGIDVNVIIFSNKFKQTDKHPTHVVFLGNRNRNQQHPHSGYKSNNDFNSYEYQDEDIPL